MILWRRFWGSVRRIIKVRVSRRQALLSSYGLILPNEVLHVRAVLNAAAFTYVAAATQAISTMLC